MAKNLSVLLVLLTLACASGLIVRQPVVQPRASARYVTQMCTKPDTDLAADKSDFADFSERIVLTSQAWGAKLKSKMQLSKIKARLQALSPTKAREELPAEQPTAFSVNSSDPLASMQMKLNEIVSDLREVNVNATWEGLQKQAQEHIDDQTKSLREQLMETWTGLQTDLQMLENATKQVYVAGENATKNIIWQSKTPLVGPTSTAVDGPTASDPVTTTRRKRHIAKQLLRDAVFGRPHGMRASLRTKFSATIKALKKEVAAKFVALSAVNASITASPADPAEAAIKASEDAPPLDFVVRETAQAWDRLRQLAGLEEQEKQLHKLFGATKAPDQQLTSPENAKNEITSTKSRLGGNVGSRKN